MGSAWGDMLRGLKAAIEHPGLRVDEELPDAFAAVAVVLHMVGPEPSMLWIQRAEDPRDPWSGQMGFPGGRAAPEDASPRACAVRETQEEIGLGLERAGEYLGPLHDVRARNRQGVAAFRVSPHVFWVEALPGLALDPAEVAATHSIALRHLLDPRHVTSLDWVHGDLHLKLPAIGYQGQFIWGLSLKILNDFTTRLAATGLGAKLGARAP